MSDDLRLPGGVEAIPSPTGLRLSGAREPLTEALEALRLLSACPEGHRVSLGRWTLEVSDYVPVEPDPWTVVMPADAWKVAPSVLRDAVLGEYGAEHAAGEPFDFAMVGYLGPVAYTDIGVQVVVSPPRGVGR